METYVINFYGGPGVGKSTTASGVFNNLKETTDLKCEYITEYAKELTYASNPAIENQLLVSGIQWERMRHCIGKVDVIICDSPIMTGAVYTDIPYFKFILLHLHNNTKSFNFVLNRTKEYKQYGRSQSKDEAINKDNLIENLLKEMHIQYTNIETGVDSDIATVKYNLRLKGYNV